MEFNFILFFRHEQFEMVYVEVFLPLVDYDYGSDQPQLWFFLVSKVLLCMIYDDMNNTKQFFQQFFQLYCICDFQTQVEDVFDREKNKQYL